MLKEFVDGDFERNFYTFTEQEQLLFNRFLAFK